MFNMPGKVTFQIPGEPFGKQRPKFSTAGGFARSYTPKETVSYENLVKMEYERQCGGKMAPGDEEVLAVINAFFSIPKSVSKKKRADMLEGKIRPTKRPDCDNIAKIILDALNGMAYRDDAQVVSAVVGKHYGETPHVEVQLFVLGRDIG